MNKSIIFFDIDGTLIDEKTHIIPDSAKKAIRLARKNGHLAFINTGRTLCQIKNLKKEIDFDGFICGCGTYIEYNNETLYHKCLGVDFTKKLIKSLKKYKLDAALESIDGVYYDYLYNIKHKEVLNIIEAHKHEGTYEDLTWDSHNLNVDKLVLFITEYSNFEGFFQEFKDTLDFIKRADDFYELAPKGCSKATGIEFIINHLNIDFENTFGIGDSTNDLTMLQYVKNSIAMGNSNPQLFEHVNYITTDLLNDGIYSALAHYNLI